MFNQPTKRTLWQSWTISLCVLFRFVYLATFGSRNETLAGRIFWTKINQYGDRLRWTRIDCDVPSASLALSQFFFPPLFSYSNGQKDRWTRNDTLLLTTLTITREKEKLEKKVKEKIRLFHFPFNEMTQNRQQLKSSAANSFSFGRCHPPLPPSLFFLMPFCFLSFFFLFPFLF